MATCRYNLVFLVSSLGHGGAERVLEYLLLNCPVDRFDASVVHVGGSRSSSLRRFQLGKSPGSFARIHCVGFPIDWLPSLRLLPNTPSAVPRILNEVVRLGVQSLLENNWTMSDQFLRLVGQSDLIYLFDNDLVRLIPSENRPVIAGSTHNLSVTAGDDLLPARLRWMYRGYTNRNYQKIHALHFTSEAIHRRSIVHTEDDFVVPIGVDTNLFHPSVRESVGGTVRFLSGGRLEPEKGFLPLLQAWKTTRRSNFELHIFGTGSLRSQVERLTKNDHSVKYHGYLDDIALAELYRQCHVFIFPTIQESFGLVGMEALASGLYLIVSEHQRGIFDEFDLLGYSKYVFPEPASISSEMLSAARSIDLIRRRRWDVHNKVKSTYDWKTISESLFAEFTQLIEKSTRANDLSQN